MRSGRTVSAASLKALFAIALVALVACRAEPRSEMTAASPLVAMDAEAPPPSPAPPLPARRLKLVKTPLPGVGLGPVRCSVVDDDTGEVLGRATNRETAAGGTDVDCVGFALDGRVIVFENSRGKYAKDARVGKSNDRSLACGAGVFADDLSSCVELDASPFAYGLPDDDDAPFIIELCDLSPTARAREEPCRALATVPRGLNRSFASRRPWDAAYCGSDRIAVVANGELRVHAAPSGKLLARTPAPKMTAVSCANEADIMLRGGGADAATAAKPRRFRLVADTLARIDDEG